MKIGERKRPREPKGISETDIVFAGKTRDDVCTDSGHFRTISDILDLFPEIGSVVRPVHRFQDPVITALHGNMEMGGYPFCGGEEIQQTICYFADLDAAQPDTKLPGRFKNCFDKGIE